MPTFADLEAASSVQTKLNNAILRTDAVVVIATTSQLADLTYTTGNAWTVASGTKVYVLMGNYSYEVQASGAATYDLEVDGIRLNVLPNEANEYPFDAMLPAKDGTTDDLPKLNTLILNKSFITNAGAGQRMGPTIRFGYGRYYFNGTISPKAQIRLIGQYTGYGNERSTDFLFPPATAGIIVNRFNTNGVASEAVNVYGADGSEFIGLKLIGGRGDAFDATQSGIWLRARASVVNCATISFAGHGVFAGAGSDGNPYQGNCNLFRVRHLYTEFNRGDGFCADGTDANAGTVEYVNAKSNDGAGVREAAFLRNYHAGHHAISNAGGAYQFENNSPMYSAYVEDGGGSNVNSGGPMIGLMATNVDAGSIGPLMNVVNANGFRGWSNQRGGLIAQYGNVTAHLNTQADNILIGQYSGNATPWRILYRNSGTDVAIVAGSSGSDMIRFTGTGTGFNPGRSGTVAGACNIPSLFLGLNSAARGMTTGSAAPTSGEWARGDIVFNNAPSAGGKIGWVCTTAGTPGTWKAWGVIDP